MSSAKWTRGRGRAEHLPPPRACRPGPRKPTTHRQRLESHPHSPRHLPYPPLLWGEGHPTCSHATAASPVGGAPPTLSHLLWPRARAVPSPWSRGLRASASCPREVNAGGPAAAVTAGGHPVRLCVTSGRGTGVLRDSANHGAGHHLGSTLPWGLVCVTSSTGTWDPRTEPWALVMEGRRTVRRAPLSPPPAPGSSAAGRASQAPGPSSECASEAGAQARHRRDTWPLCPLPGPRMKKHFRGRPGRSAEPPGLVTTSLGRPCPSAGADTALT